MKQFQTPILFLIFNRPDLTKIVFERIREIRPSILFIAADGPRAELNSDKEKCVQARQAVMNNIDWQCEVKTLFRKENLGCGKGPEDAISWFFEFVEKGIILEDDCLPNISFFPYCQELLTKYEDNSDIMHISGLNWLNNQKMDSFSYYFSKYPGIWGWATWRDRWAKYDFQLKSLESFVKENKIQEVTSNKKEQQLHINTFWEARKMNDNLHIWDYQWKYAIFNNSGICITPNKNLISNIGFGVDATHTKEVTWRYKNSTEEMESPLIHPPTLKVNRKADRFMSKKIFPKTSIYNTIITSIKHKIRLLLNLLNSKT